MEGDGEEKGRKGEGARGEKEGGRGRIRYLRQCLLQLIQHNTRCRTALATS